MKKRSVLFICTHNSARSQLAEGLVNYFFSEYWEAHSAGTEQTSVKPLAVEAMKDIGIDISRQFSKTIDYYKDEKFDLVITVCNDARENCPIYPNAQRIIHLPFKDPSNKTGNQKKKLKAFIQTRDEIKKKLQEIL